MIDVNCIGELYLNNKKQKTYRDKDGYVVYINGNLEKKNHKIHRLVASKYLFNKSNKGQVNHINGIKSDNRITNLEWASASDNLKHSYKFLNRKSPAKGVYGKDNWLSKSVLQVSLDGFILNEFDNATIASSITGIARQNICKCRNKTIKKAGGYIWI